MIVHLFPNLESLGRLAARHIEVALLASPTPVLGVATGSSPDPLYSALAERARVGTFSPRRLRVFALDEYVGLLPGSVQGYRRELNRIFSGVLALDGSGVEAPDGDASDVGLAAEQYEQAIMLAGGIDVQILGIGQNGHIGFNEPGSDLRSLTRVVDLTDSTRAANARFFDRIDEVPVRSISQGLGTIMRARATMLIATGLAKAEIMCAALTGPVTENVPASILQRHPRLTVLLDAEASSALDIRLLRSAAIVHDWR
ncbi:MAG: glucosamine-6-phosphate deaminase [Rhodoglobus sp.]